MNDKADIMIENIRKQIGKGTSINIQNPITLCALDIIIETAMGAVSNLQSAGESEYVNAILSGKNTVPAPVRTRSAHTY